MTGFRYVGVGLWMVAALAAQGQTTLTPAEVVAGSPELIRVCGVAAVSRMEGEWLGRKIGFFREGACWYALAGVDVEAAVGPSRVTITGWEGERDRDFSMAATVHAAHYKTGSLTVAPRFVEPGPEDQAEIAAAVAAKEKAFATSDGRPLWEGSFVAPVRAEATDSFGTRRMFNGKLASIHKGMDFKAGMGTPVMAGNAGRVVLAEKLYFEGNCVMVDHGQGLMTISMHLSRIDVKAGEMVVKGQRLGLSGATGRVTGPHLHWAVRWQGAMLDPAKLLGLDLGQLP